MINQVILVGNLGADPELRSTGSGVSVCSISLATSSRFKDKEGEWQDKTEWHKVVIWGGSAEFISKYAAKGRQIYIQGRLQTRKWTDQDGNDRYSTEVVAEVAKLLGPKPAGDSQEPREERRQTRPAAERDGGRAAPAEPLDEDDAIPF